MIAKTYSDDTPTAATPAAADSQTIDRDLALVLAYSYREDEEAAQARGIDARLALRALIDGHVTDPAVRAQMEELVSEIRVTAWLSGTAFARSVDYNQTISRTVYATPVPPLPPRELDEQTKHDPDTM